MTPYLRSAGKVAAVSLLMVLVGPFQFVNMLILGPEFASWNDVHVNSLEYEKMKIQNRDDPDRLRVLAEMARERRENPSKVMAELSLIKKRSDDS